MTKRLKIKICGINDPLSMLKACSLNIDYIGLVFFKNSPRNISLSIAESLIKHKKNNTKIVALTVNPDNELLDGIFEKIKPEYIQLHGNEKPSRCFEIKTKYKVKIIKAIEVKNLHILVNNINKYKKIVNTLLLDSPKLSLPGGNGKSFNWKILKKYKINVDWLLAGGVNANNVNKAIKFTNAKGVDISSGVEVSKGKKTPQLIENFVRKCRNI